MSDTRHQRFEIDLDEIERQLRRSVEGASAAAAQSKSDPLAELARIVGQDDPFRNILGATPVAKAAMPSSRSEDVPPAPQVDHDATLDFTHEDLALLRGEPELRAGPSRFDPVADAYGSVENAVDVEDLQPLRPRRSRGRLAALVAVLGVAAAGVAGAVAYRNTGGSFNFTGVPPIIKADTSPVKVAPENPGGIEIPDQNKQIYERGTQEGRSRMVDRQEQPIDVREAVRSLPNPTPEVSTPAPPTQATAALDPVPRSNPTIAAAPPSGVSNALGEPRRVRTVSVRPDGSTLAPGSQTAVEPSPTYIPSIGVPPPVSVPTSAIPANTQPYVPATSDGTTPAAAPAPVTVLPPQRPRGNALSATATPASAPRTATTAARTTDPAAEPADGGPLQIGAARSARPSQRVATAPQPAIVPDAQDVAPAATAAPTSRGTYSVQIASQSTEQQARTTYDELSDKYATELGGRPASVAPAKVGGKTVYRVKVGPLTREAANTLCTRLKASGGACTVSAN